MLCVDFTRREYSVAQPLWYYFGADALSQSVKQHTAWVIMSVQFQKHYFTVDEYYRMAKGGVFSEDDRVELIEGEVVEMSPIGSTHQGCVDALSTILTRRLGRAAIVRVQGPIHIDEYSEPQPDICLLKPRSDFYRRSHPVPADVLLVIEVADTSIQFDRNVKLPLYARVGIPEAWLIVLMKDFIEVHSEPTNGKYQKVQRLKRGKKLISPTIPSLTLNVDSILG
ncbi:MAG: Uma2 family endonuclease [Acidobacteriota bacterium]